MGRSTRGLCVCFMHSRESRVWTDHHAMMHTEWECWCGIRPVVSKLDTCHTALYRQNHRDVMVAKMAESAWFLLRFFFFFLGLEFPTPYSLLRPLAAVSPSLPLSLYLGWACRMLKSCYRGAFALRWCSRHVWRGHYSRATLMVTNLQQPFSRCFCTKQLKQKV